MQWPNRSGELDWVNKCEKQRCLEAAGAVEVGEWAYADHRNDNHVAVMDCLVDLGILSNNSSAYKSHITPTLMNFCVNFLRLGTTGNLRRLLRTGQPEIRT